MTALASLVVSRTLLGLSPLTIDSEGFSTYYIDKAGLGRVGKTPRETFATAPPWTHGRLRTAVVLDESTWAVNVRVQSDSSADLDTACVALEAAFEQFTYTVTQTVDGVVKVWSCSAATIQSTDALVAFERVTAFHEDLSISIPVYPVAS